MGKQVRRVRVSVLNIFRINFQLVWSCCFWSHSPGSEQSHCLLFLRTLPWSQCAPLRTCQNHLVFHRKSSFFLNSCHKPEPVWDVLQYSTVRSFAGFIFAAKCTTEVEEFYKSYRCMQLNSWTLDDTSFWTPLGLFSCAYFEPNKKCLFNAEVKLHSL